MVLLSVVVGTPSAAVVVIQYAAAVGSVTLVNALNGLEFAILIILVFLLSKFWPKKFQENYSTLVIIQESVAVIVIGIGLFLLV